MSVLYVMAVFLLSLMWALLIAVVVEGVSLDFQPIVEVISVFREVEGVGAKLYWAFSGNTLLLFFLDLAFPGLSPLEQTKLLYVFAAFVRCFVLFLIFRPYAAVCLLFAFTWAFDLNQARLSVAFSFYLLFLVSKRPSWAVLAMLTHNLVWPLALYRVVPKSLRVISLVGGLALIVMVVPIVFPRYLVVFEGHQIPKNILIYVILALPIIWGLFRLRLSAPEIQVCGGLFFALFFLVRMGMSPVYLGRVAELLFHVTVVYMFLYATNIGYQKQIGRSVMVVQLFSYAMAVSILVGLYQVATISGNIWRFF
ncbi:hypothetical protein [Agaribacterium haliotis]|uniref:hypothetical protein n=1 Tax=Agaribacterium haliotis TaxID=2013869 RepID=UPI001178A24A|nr:hypothetical protein [Agaribacterium haliotis]